MNYSDYDSDGYSSNEDEDYVPSEDNLSEDDISQCDREEPLEDTVPQPEHQSSKKKKKKDGDVRKRKQLLMKVESTEKDEAGEPLEEPVQSLGETEKVDEQKQKKSSDDLWERFLQDVGSRPKHSSGASATAQKESPPPPRTLDQEGAPATVTITKVFDFAGEQVQVNKEVSADSREAKSYQRSQSVAQATLGEQESCSPSVASPPAASAKRPAGLSHLLGVMGGKKPKMSTLEKSKMDWDAFKSEEGITEELAIHNRGRDGYVERKNFLERVDHRQFEREKAVRLSNMKQ